MDSGPSAQNVLMLLRPCTFCAFQVFRSGRRVWHRSPPSPKPLQTRSGLASSSSLVLGNDQLSKHLLMPLPGVRRAKCHSRSMPDIFEKRLQ